MNTDNQNHQPSPRPDEDTTDTPERTQEPRKGILCDNYKTLCDRDIIGV